MSRAEIIARANEAFQEAVDRARVRRTEILRQREAALSEFPAASNAIRQHALTLAKAGDDLAEAERVIGQVLADAEAEADATHRAGDAEALRESQQADEEAFQTLTREMAAAEDAFSEALRAASQRPSLVEQDQARNAARQRRDAARTTADNKFRKAKDADFERLQKTTADALEAHIAAVQKARGTADQSTSQAQRARENAERAADTELRQALNADPLAASVNETFLSKLRAADEDAEREKAAILEQMRRDLENAS